LGVRAEGLLGNKVDIRTSGAVEVPRL
jgi:hypothetical protein